MLALSRAEPVNGLVAPPQRVDLAVVARDTVVELLPLAVRKQIDLGYEREDDLPAMVSGQTVLLREMIANLIDNALRYTPEGGLVTVTVAHREDGVYVMVRDNGPGIPEAQRQNVFLRFFRLETTDTLGSGLGLSIVREIVLAHDGEIELADAPGGGLLVSVRLPAA
ncbi:Sensor histidine kinase TodS [bioreactor metagenome]|uniref:histidine kinase n=1 Tax=bioreactor metagenome TaxID=1076179 RepID=A0A645ITZ7_9ZZZZ